MKKLCVGLASLAFVPGCLTLGPQARMELSGRPMPIESSSAKPRSSPVVRADQITPDNAHEVLEALREEVDRDATR